MKIYQLHRYGGEWEDTYDYIIGSYLRKERAEEALTQAQEEDLKQQAYGKHCLNCPYMSAYNPGVDVDYTALEDEMKQYCDHRHIIYDEYGMIYCENWEGIDFYTNHFRIEVVEVEE